MTVPVTGLVLHQPYRLRRFSYFDAGNEGAYFDEVTAQRLFDDAANQIYLPALIQIAHQPESHMVLVEMSGVFYEQCSLFTPQVIEILVQLVQSRRVGFLSTTYFNVFADYVGCDETSYQVSRFHALIERQFGVAPLTDVRKAAPLSSFNRIQQAAIERALVVGSSIKESVGRGSFEDSDLLETWRRLLSFDHFLLMNTKRPVAVACADSDWIDPYEAFIAYMNIMRDLELRISTSFKVPQEVASFASTLV